jgi:hypothetical protein
LQDALLLHALQLFFSGGAGPPGPLQLAFAGLGFRFFGDGFVNLLFQPLLSGNLGQIGGCTFDGLTRSMRGIQPDLNKRRRCWRYAREAIIK